MVTHDVDEAIYLSDRIIMMTSGPYAKVGDILEVKLPRPRTKEEVIEHPDYYKYRDHLIRFLEELDISVMLTPLSVILTPCYS